MSDSLEDELESVATDVNHLQQQYDKFSRKVIYLLERLRIVLELHAEDCVNVEQFGRRRCHGLCQCF